MTQAPRSDSHPPEWRKGLFSLLDQAVVSFTNFLTMIMVARFGNGEGTELALYALGWSIVGLSKTAQERIISAPYFVFSLRPDVDSEKYLGSALVHQSIQGGAISAILVICAGIFAWMQFFEGMPIVFLAIAIAIPFILMRDFIRTICAVAFRNDVSFVMSSATALIQLGGIVWMIYSGSVAATGVFLLMGFACLFPCALWYGLRAQAHQIESSAIKSDWLMTWQYSRWLVAARSIGIATGFLLPWLTLFYVGAKGAGDFATCMSLVGLSAMLVVGSNNFFQPRAIHAYQSGGNASLIRSLTENALVILGMLGGLALVYLVAAGWLLETIYGKGFGANHWVVVLLGLHALVIGLSFVVANGLAALERPQGLFLAELSYFVVAIVSCLALLPKYGLIGASIGLCVASVVGTSISLANLVRLLQGPERRTNSELTSKTSPI